MSDEDTRQSRAKKFKQRNQIARKMFENKGAFGLKVHNPKKPEYKRERLDKRHINGDE